jgi:putative DNA primase/helicase
MSIPTNKNPAGQGRGAIGFRNQSGRHYSIDEQFRDAIQAAGLAPPDEIHADGKLHRFAPNGKRGDDAGWYVLHHDGIPAGTFGDWRTGTSQTWRADIGRSLTPAEEAAHRARVEAQRRERDAEQERQHAEAAKGATALWDAAAPAPEGFPYFQRKGIKPHGARLHEGRLTIPVRVGGVITSLQFINADGDKKFLPGGRVAGGYYAIGTPDEIKARGALVICEGFATGASIREATDLPVVIAFNAGNLRAVAEYLRGKFLAARIVIAGDVDRSGTGQAKATEAAQAVDGIVALPTFTPEELATDRPPSDFNDLARLRGADAVKQAIESALQGPPASAPMPSPAPATASAPAGEWPAPLPLPDDLLPVASLDFALLPKTLEPWARDICERVQCAPDYVAAAIMAGLGSIIGRKLGIRPQARTDWTETANQWALIVGRPGVLKSPAIEAALAPIKRLAAVATEAHKADMERHRIEVRAAKLRAEEGEKSARKLLGKMPGADVAHLLNTEEPEAPALRRYIAVDSNAASLGELHRQNLNGFLVHRDEMVSLLKSLDREDQAEARGFYLTGWNGNSSYTFDRIGRGLNLHIPAVCLSMLGSTQPGRIAEYIRHAVRGGAGDDGLIQRFGLLVWPDTGGEWQNVDRWPDSTARKEAHRVFEYLDKLDPATVGALQDTDHDGEPEGIPYLRFDDAALGLFLEWRTDLEARLRGGDLHPALESHLAKYRKLVPSLALILHLANNGTGPVTERAALQALAWAEYLETHARRAYGSVTVPEVAAAKAIISRIRKGDLKREFSSREVWRPGWAMLADREQVADALRLLVDFDWLATTTKTDTGGRPATIYTANPRGFA